MLLVIRPLAFLERFPRAHANSFHFLLAFSLSFLSLLPCSTTIMSRRPDVSTLFSVKVDNISRSTREDDLREAFKEFGLLQFTCPSLHPLFFLLFFFIHVCVCVFCSSHWPLAFHCTITWPSAHPPSHTISLLLCVCMCAYECVCVHAFVFCVLHAWCTGEIGDIYMPR